MRIKDILMYMLQQNRNGVLIMGKGISKFIKKVLFAPVVTGIGYLFAIMPRMIRYNLNNRLLQEKVNQNV